MINWSRVFTNMLLTWEPNPCGLDAESYSIYVRNFSVRGKSVTPDFTASEIVENGVLLVEGLTERQFIYSGIIGPTKSTYFAVIAHASDGSKSYPATIKITGDWLKPASGLDITSTTVS